MFRLCLSRSLSLCVSFSSSHHLVFFCLSLVSFSILFFSLTSPLRLLYTFPFLFLTLTSLKLSIFLFMLGKKKKLFTEKKDEGNNRRHNVRRRNRDIKNYFSFHSSSILNRNGFYKITKAKSLLKHLDGMGFIVISDRIKFFKVTLTCYKGILCWHRLLTSGKFLE